MKKRINVYGEDRGTIGEDDFIRFKSGYYTNVFLRGSRGYVSMIAEENLPKLSVDIYINDRYCGCALVRNSYSITNIPTRLEECEEINGSYELKSDRKYYPIVRNSYWRKQNELIVPFIELDVTNQLKVPDKEVILKVNFYEGKKLWSKNTYVLISSGDMPLKIGYKKTAFIYARQGYRKEFENRSLLPNIIAEVFINDELYGEIEIDDTYKAKYIEKTLVQKEK